MITPAGHAPALVAASNRERAGHLCQAKIIGSRVAWNEAAHQHAIRACLRRDKPHARVRRPVVNGASDFLPVRPINNEERKQVHHAHS